MAHTLHTIGRYLNQMNKPSDAREYLERAVIIEQKISSNVSTDRSVALSFLEIGRCLIRNNNLSDGKNYLEKALKIQRRISGNVMVE